MDKQKSGKAKRDALLLIFILAGAAALLIIFFSMRSCRPAEKVRIKVDGNIYWEGLINEDATVEVEGFEGGYNTVVVKDSEVSVTDADCPDKVCVNSGRIDTVGQTIVCLPHRMVVEISSR